MNGNKALKKDFAEYYLKYGFKDPEKYIYKEKAGLSRETVERISEMKKEPKWMRDFRLKSLDTFLKKPMPSFGPSLSDIDFKKICYYLKPTEKGARKWNDVPETIRKTFERLGIPEAERKFLGGVGAMYESEVIYHKLREDLEKKGVIFCDTDTALREHEELFKKYFGSVVPPGDNKFAALNSAVWSGGSFIYVPKGVKVEIPLQAYFRINSPSMGQFERTLIIADEGSTVHYVEGCFTKGATIHANPDFKPIEEVKVGDSVLSHTGEYRTVYHTQVRPYTGNLYKISVYGNSIEETEVTEEHPFLSVKRERARERNKNWKAGWMAVKNLRKRDYLLTPRNRNIISKEFAEIEIDDRRKGKGPKSKVRIPSTKEFFRLAGYYLAEGSTDRGYYLHFSFGSHEKEYIKDVKSLLRTVFGIEKTYDSEHKTNHGISIVVSSAKLSRTFETLFGKGCDNKRIPYWMILEDPEKQKELIIGLYRGDGNYYRKRIKSCGWLKEVFRINTTSQKLAKQTRDILLRLGIAAFINARDRKKEGRRTMYTIGITGEYMKEFGRLVGMTVEAKLNGKKRATMFYIDRKYLYSPIRKIKKNFVKDIDVYNFSVGGDESYIVNSIAVHNCSAPIYTSESLHAAVVEIIAKKDAKVRYTTIQNWSTNVYNLVTKRAHAYEGAVVEWLDGNLGSKITMKYPSVYLMGPNSKAEILSIAFAGKNQNLDAGGKILHLAPNTSSKILSKSISKDGGITTFRGLVRVKKGCTGVKSYTKCDALILDEKSKSDTIPSLQVDEKDVNVGHEATVGKISEEQLFYLMSRGLKEEEAVALIIKGFIAPFVKELPMEYAIELNRLVELEMEGAIA